jgi:dTDP-4-dehydrorhamnose reductase
VNDLAGVLLQMLSQNLTGLFHVVGADCVSKYEFACEIACRLGIAENMVTPIRVEEFGLKAVRSNNLRLNTDKLQKVLHKPIPRLSTGLDSFFTQYQQSYPHLLRRMVDNSSEDPNPYRHGGNNGA